MRRGEIPDPHTYLSYRAYLADWFQARKAADARFSHRLFARKAGVHSPSFLKEVMDGKRNLTAAALDGVLAALDLGREERAFFSELVRLEQAETDADRNAAWERISASRRFREAARLQGASVRYLSNGAYAAVRELALRTDFRDDPAWIAGELLPRISVAAARQALDTLLELGLLVREKGRVVPAQVSLVTPHEVAGLAAHNYHRDMLARAAESIEAVAPEDRHLLGVTVAIPRRLVPRLKAELDAMQERLLDLCDRHAGEAEQVYQVQLQLFPLSRAMEPR